MQSAQIEAESHQPGLSSRTWMFLALSLSAICHVVALMLLADVGAVGNRTMPIGGASMKWVVLAPSAAPTKPSNMAPAALEPEPRDRESKVVGDAGQQVSSQPPPYLPRGLLQQAPVPISEIDPVYPEAAGGLSGSVVLRLRINESGDVDSAEVVSASRPGLFDRAAIEAFSAAKFEPGRALGRPVKSELVVEVAFATVNKGAVRDAIR